MAPTRSQLASLLVSLAAHAALILLVATVTWTVVSPRPLIPISMLPGGGGGGESGGEGAREAPEPAAPPVEEAPKKIEVKPQAVAKVKPPVERKEPKRIAPVVPPAESAAPAEVAVAVPGDGGSGNGAGAGMGPGAGGGNGGGVGSGAGAGRGAGADLDLRLYCLSCPEPPYPRLARARGWQGATDVELTVLADGRVEGAMVSRSSGFEVLDDAALEVARQSRFSPPPRTLDPPVRGRLAYRFELRER